MSFSPFCLVNFYFVDRKKVKGYTIEKIRQIDKKY